MKKAFSILTLFLGLVLCIQLGCMPQRHESAPVLLDSSSNSARILLVGDTHLAENYFAEFSLGEGKANILDMHGYDYGFDGVRALLESSDYVIANLETPVTDLPSSPLEGKKKFIHWADPKNTPSVLARHNIRVVSLANNHALDYSLPGLQQTIKHLERHGIVVFGAGLSETQAANPHRLEIYLGDNIIRMAILGGYWYRKSYDSRYKFYARGKSGGVRVLNDDSFAKQIRILKQTDPDMFIVVFPHWGKNYRWRNQEQISLAHALIDAGADLIIGHGAHVFQEIEQYHDRWIIYNLGNFVFLIVI